MKGVNRYGQADKIRRYDDILKRPHHRSLKHPSMPMLDRAAQFAPFAALTGHGDTLKETARPVSYTHLCGLLAVWLVDRLFDRIHAARLRKGVQ